MERFEELERRHDELDQRIEGIQQQCENIRGEGLIKASGPLPQKMKKEIAAEIVRVIGKNPSQV